MHLLFFILSLLNTSFIVACDETLYTPITTKRTLCDRTYSEASAASTECSPRSSRPSRRSSGVTTEKIGSIAAQTTPELITYHTALIAQKTSLHDKLTRVEDELTLIEDEINTRIKADGIAVGPITEVDPAIIEIITNAECRAYNIISRHPKRDLIPVAEVEERLESLINQCSIIEKILKKIKDTDHYEPSLSHYHTLIDLQKKLRALIKEWPK